TALLEGFGTSDPLVADALRSIIDGGDLIPEHPHAASGEPAGAADSAESTGPAAIATDPAIVTGLIERERASFDALQDDIRGVSGTAVFDLILTDLAELTGILSDPLSVQVRTAAMAAASWLNEHILSWLGERDVA